MNDADVVKAVATAFEYCYLHDEWVTPLSEALEGITAAHAFARPADDGKGIWDIVLHVALWNENIVARIQGGGIARPAEGAWPSPPDTPDPARWEEAKQRLWSSLGAIETMLKTTSLATIQESTYGLPDLLCRFTHIAYHIGQITKLREGLSG